ncbi:universal stress protein [Flavobacteriaceae bacterium 3-367]
MKNVLIPVDFSDNSWNAVQYAKELFQRTPCVFYLFHINAIAPYSGAETSIVGSSKVLEEAVLQESQERLDEVLKRIEQLPVNTEHRFETLTVYDFFVDAIRKQIADKKIDLIVMGTKGASGLKKVTMGSNTADVITKVKCPVLAVPENAEYKKPKEIGFPTDFNLSYDIKVLDTLIEIVQMHHAALRVLYISGKGEELNSEQHKNKAFLHDYFKDLEHSFHRVTSKKLETAVQCFVESRDLDMISMVAKNVNFLQRVLLRPAVQEISYHTDVPFLVLHE